MTLFNVIANKVEGTFFNFILLAISLSLYMGQILSRSSIGGFFSF
ncbi:hypothetical protein [Psychromonas sp. MB-3u-54]|nr:hypothetical protein [Psychromonas sp. MB-3u-54]